MPPLNWTTIIFGCVGGLIPDILRIIQNRHNTRLPDYLKTGSFWLGLILLFLLGGFVAWLAGASTVKDALAFGFGGPEIISKLLSEPKPAPPPVKGAASLSLRSWWAA